MDSKNRRYAGGRVRGSGGINDRPFAMFHLVTFSRLTKPTTCGKIVRRAAGVTTARAEMFQWRNPPPADKAK